MATRKPSELSAAGLQRVLKDAWTRVAKETFQRGLAITVAELMAFIARPEAQQLIAGREARLNIDGNQLRIARLCIDSYLAA